MISQISEYLLVIQEFMHSNPVLGGVLGVGFLGSAIAFLRSIPIKIYYIIKKQCLTTATFASDDWPVYSGFSRWFHENELWKKSRFLKIESAYRPATATDSDMEREHRTDAIIDKIGLSPGIGTSYIWVNFRLYVITMTLLEKAGSDSIRYQVEIITIGRSYKAFSNLLSIFERYKNGDSDDTKLVIYKLKPDRYRCLVRYDSMAKTDLSSSCVEESKKKLLVKTILDFRAKYQWYKKHSIPHRLGILLHGPPGTGKTTLIKALVSELLGELTICNSGALEVGMPLPNNMTYLFEDIDRELLSFDSHPRSGAESINKNVYGENSSGEKKEKKVMNLGQMLQSLDGVTPSEHRIVIMTTNHIDELPSSLIRPGRIDLTIEVGYANIEILDNFIKKFFPEYKANFNGLEIKPKISPASIQNMVLLGKGPEEIISELTKEGDV